MMMSNVHHTVVSVRELSACTSFHIDGNSLVLDRPCGRDTVVPIVAQYLCSFRMDDPKCPVLHGNLRAVSVGDAPVSQSMLDGLKEIYGIVDVIPPLSLKGLLILAVSNKVRRLNMQP
jgi:hypothetical protein